MERLLPLIIAGLIGACANLAAGDLIPNGHVSVRHELVFTDSPQLENFRLVAAPMAGFNGVVEIKEGIPFPFSTKYGTRFYWFPKTLTLLPEFDHETYVQFQSVKVPVSEIKSAPRLSPLRSALTRLKLESITNGKPVINVLLHQEFDSRGQPVSETRHMLIVCLPIFVGLVGCWGLYRWRVKSRRKTLWEAQTPQPVDALNRDDDQYDYLLEERSGS